MLSTGLRHFTDIPITIVGLLIFFVCFSGIAIWTFFRRRSREYYREISELPLNEGDANERRK